VCSDVRVELLCSLLQVRPFRFATANQEDETCMDVSAVDVNTRRHLLMLKCLMLMHMNITPTVSE